MILQEVFEVFPRNKFHNETPFHFHNIYDLFRHLRVSHCARKGNQSINKNKNHDKKRQIETIFLHFQIFIHDRGQDSQHLKKSGRLDGTVRQLSKN